MRKSIIIFSLFTMLYFGIPAILVLADDYTPVNHPPVAKDISLTTEVATAITFMLEATDLDGDVLTFSVNPPDNAAVTCNDSENACTFMPDANFIGTVSFGYSVSDGYTQDEATITVAVTEPNNSCVEDDSGQLDVGAGVGSSGGLVRIPVRINNAPNDVSAFGFDLVFDPAILTYKSFDRGSLTEDFEMFNVNVISEGVLRCAGMQNDGIHVNASGTVLFAEFEVNNAEPETQLSLQSLKDNMAEWTVSTGCLSNGCNGDINADGEITPMDALNTFEKYLQICPTSSNLDCENVCGDVNKDGETTPADTLCIFRYYLGQPNCLDSSMHTPEAHADASPKSGQAPLTVWFTAEYDESQDANRVKYEWDFQDDGTFDEDGQEVHFTYFEEGTYTAILRVTDQDGMTATDEISIVVEPGENEEREINIIARPSQGKAPLHVHFYADDYLDPIYPTGDFEFSGLEDESNGKDGKNTRFWHWPPIFPKNKFEWDFNGDGKVDARGKDAKWVFKEIGEHPVVVKGIYEDGTVAIGKTVIKVHEKESFVHDKIFIVARPSIGLAPLKSNMYVACNFLSREELQNAEFVWDFNDDGQSDAEGIEVEHTFEEVGEHRVKVLITYGDDIELTAEHKIIVKEDFNEPLESKIIARPDSGPAPLEVKFSLSRNKFFNATTNECRIQWDFQSDGTIDANGPFVSHVYEEEGEFVATCQITDVNGNVYKTETIITVGEENTIFPEISEQIMLLNETLEPIFIQYPNIMNNIARLIAKTSNPELIPDGNISIEQNSDGWMIQLQPELGEYGWADISLYLIDEHGDAIDKTLFELIVLENEDDYDKDDFDKDDFDKDDYDKDDFDKDDYEDDFDKDDYEDDFDKDDYEDDFDKDDFDKDDFDKDDFDKDDFDKDDFDKDDFDKDDFDKDDFDKDDYDKDDYDKD